MSFTLNAVAQAKGSHSKTGANDSAEPLNTTRSRSRTPGAKRGVSPTSSHHLFSREPCCRHCRRRKVHDSSSFDLFLEAGALGQRHLRARRKPLTGASLFKERHLRIVSWQRCEVYGTLVALLRS